MSGCSRIRSTTTLSPCTMLKHPSGRPACFSSSARNIDGDGSFSPGLRMNVLPQGEGVGEHPQRDHRREVERRDPATTPSGSDGVLSTPLRRLLAAACPSTDSGRRRRTRRSPTLGRLRRARPRGPCRALPTAAKSSQTTTVGGVSVGGMSEGLRRC